MPPLSGAGVGVGVMMMTASPTSSTTQRRRWSEWSCPNVAGCAATCRRHGLMQAGFDISG